VFSILHLTTLSTSQSIQRQMVRWVMKYGYELTRKLIFTTLGIILGHFKTCRWLCYFGK